ncbi:MAG: hypothetical protein VYC91_04585, partial [Acidobacteriota bacterium]|nr:hypothetical protein [Acidobacteriota bacterium]
MQKFLTLCALGLLVQGVGFSQQVPELVAEHGYADMVLANGKIVTMDDWSTTPDTPGNIHQSMAIKGKKIMALGSDEEMRGLAGPSTRFLDVQGHTVIPGLIQTHYHLFGPAASRYGPEVGLLDPSVQLTVEAGDSPESTSKKLRDAILNAIRVQNIPKGKWISVRLTEGPNNLPGTNRIWLYGSEINRRTVQLDTAVPDHPVVVNARQSGIFNETA